MRRYSFNSLRALADMLDLIEADCDQHAASYGQRDYDISDKWVNAADAVRLAAKAVREQLSVERE